jgi:hypothetical protein
MMIANIKLAFPAAMTACLEPLCEKSWWSLHSFAETFILITKKNQFSWNHFFSLNFDNVIIATLDVCLFLQSVFFFFSLPFFLGFFKHENKKKKKYFFCSA